MNHVDRDGDTVMHVLLKKWRFFPFIITYVKRFFPAATNVNMANNEGTFIDIFSWYHLSCQINKHATQFLKLLFVAGDKITKPSDKVSKVLNEAGEMNLSNLCREVIRNHLLEMDRHKNLFGRVPRLGLPAALQSFLLYDQTLDDDDDDDDVGGSATK